MAAEATHADPKDKLLADLVQSRTAEVEDTPQDEDYAEPL